MFFFILLIIQIGKHENYSNLNLFLNLAVIMLTPNKQADGLDHDSRTSYEEGGPKDEGGVVVQD